MTSSSHGAGFPFMSKLSNRSGKASFCRDRCLMGRALPSGALLAREMRISVITKRASRSGAEGFLFRFRGRGFRGPQDPTIWHARTH